MNELLAGSVYFGLALSLSAFWVGSCVQRKWKHPLLNPLIIASCIIIAILVVFNIEYNTYEKGASYLSYFLTPVTVCLAVPLYRQIRVLEDNLLAVIISIVCGCISHAAVIVVLSYFFQLDYPLISSLLPKSVTTAIAVGISEQINGVASITLIGVSIAGTSGALFAPAVLKLFRIKEPVAQGLAIGTASHALGTTKAVELGEVQGAMSSLAIVVAGILTVVIVPIVIEIM